MPPIVGHILRRAGRSLFENLYLNLVATGVIATAVLLVGIFLSVMGTLDNLVEDWQQDIHLSAYFKLDTTEAQRLGIKERLESLPEIQAIAYITEADARTYLRERVPEVRPVLDSLGDQVLPASLEITLRQDIRSPAEIRELASRITSPEFDDIDYGQQWVERFNSFLSILRLLGLVLGTLIIVSAVFLVTNTIHLVVYNRRRELETMWLVGATRAFIGLPFLIEGLVQGLLGSSVAALGILLIQRSVLGRLQGAIALAEGPVQALPWERLLALVLMGVLLGVMGSGIAVFRFLRRAP